MFEIKAKVLADSVSEAGHRVTTMEVTGHRFILAEFNTHRAFSRNSASSRAIPYAKMREKALSQTAYPVSWPAEQRGMQGGAELDADTIEWCELSWDRAVRAAVDEADYLHDKGVHKSVISRLIEPFVGHTIIVSSTDYSNFFAQRSHPDAQPEIRVLSEAMEAALAASEPRILKANEWHRPLISCEDELDVRTRCQGDQIQVDKFLNQISAARCGRVSYLTHDGKRDHSADIDLYNKLTNHVPMHASPLEHVATPGKPKRGNFTGWVQLRQLVEDEKPRLVMD